MPRLLCLAALCLAACSSGDAEPPVQPPGPPVARLVLARFAAPGEALVLDGTRSLSPGGALVHFRFQPGDGSALLDSGAGRATHVYASEGVFQISLEVEDLQDRHARATGQLTVRSAPPGCQRDADCGAGFDTCVQARCTALWGPECAPSPDAGSCQGCARDLDCPAGRACRAGVCATP